MRSTTFVLPHLDGFIMALTPTKTETMNVTEVRRTFSETLDRVRRGETRVIVEKSGIPVGAVVSMADFARIDRDRANRTALLEALAESRKAFAGIPGDEIEAEIEKAISESKPSGSRRKGVVT